MSWLARSFVNTLRGDDEEVDEDNSNNSNSASRAIERNESTRSGVKEDLSELTKTLSKQLWGVANFLAPPPTTDKSPPATRSSVEDSSPLGTPRLAGIRNDIAEISGKVRSGISMFSTNKAVSEISKIASTFFGPEREEDEQEEERFEVDKSGSAIGVTEEVLAFARNISMHPETWLDFPLLPEEDETDDFDMSDAQQEHALAIERLAPRFAALRIELCPSHMSEACFWKIYFVLLHPRLNQHNGELLSTPQIVDARVKLQGLQSRAKQGSDRPEAGSSYKKEMLMPMPTEEHSTGPKNISNVFAAGQGAEETVTVPIADAETEKHPVSTTEVKIIDKSVIKEEPLVHFKNRKSSDEALKVPIHKFEVEGDEWLEDEDTGEFGSCHITPVQIGSDDNVSFSDLEEDDDQGDLRSSKVLETTTAPKQSYRKTRVS